MKRIIMLWSLAALWLTGGTGCQTADSSNQIKDTALAQLPKARPGEAVATFGGGCFWAIQEEFNEVKGVRTTVAGYAGGDVEFPTYEQVGTDQTGHAETVQVYYDPKVISFEKLLEGFFTGHDPTTKNRQGPDIGRDYRSIVFYRNAAEKATIDAVIKRENASGHHTGPIVTEVVPFKAFYPAEKYHQNYLKQHPDEYYIQKISVPKVEKFRKKMAGHLKDGLINL
nr:peptide-methionine (S)-S-oxide reductase MsrA [uncultured Arsenicibacter sp.]